MVPPNWWERFSRRWAHNVCLRGLGRSPIVTGRGDLSFRAKGDLKWPGRPQRSSKFRWAWKSTCTPARLANKRFTTTFAFRRRWTLGCNDTPATDNVQHAGHLRNVCSPMTRAASCFPPSCSSPRPTLIGGREHLVTTISGKRLLPSSEVAPLRLIDCARLMQATEPNSETQR